MTSLSFTLTGGPASLQVHGKIWKRPTTSHPKPVKNVGVARSVATPVTLARGPYRFYFAFGGHGTSVSKATLTVRRNGPHPRVFTKTINLAGRGTLSLNFSA